MKRINRTTIATTILAICLGWGLTAIVVLPKTHSDNKNIAESIYYLLTYPLGVIVENLLGGDSFFSEQHTIVFVAVFTAYWATIGTIIGVSIGMVMRKGATNNRGTPNQAL